MFELGVWVSTEDGLCQTLSFVAECIDIISHLTVAEYDTHTATLVSFGFAKDADAGAVLLEGVDEIVVEQRTVDGRGGFLRRENNGRCSCMLQMDAGNGSPHDGTEVEFEL